LNILRSLEKKKIVTRKIFLAATDRRDEAAAE